MIEVGEVYTVEPHLMWDGRTRCGRWHARVERLFEKDGRPWANVHEVRPVDGAWIPRMHTSVAAAHLVPVEVQLDLFGMPAGRRR